jgi:hypothetical protein
MRVIFVVDRMLRPKNVYIFVAMEFLEFGLYNDGWIRVALAQTPN